MGSGNSHKDSSWCSDKTQLLLVASHNQLYKRLSFNVLREICSYLGDQILLAVMKENVQCFNVTQNRWHQLFPMPQRINIDMASSSTFISGGSIFVCGGGSLACISQTGNSAYLLETYGAVHPLSNMLHNRSFHGIIYESTGVSVLVFGGRIQLEALKTCERYMISTAQWVALPDMSQARASFNPCLYSDVVYLCGGFTTAVELYNLRFNFFTELEEFILPEAHECTAVVEAGALVVISHSHICRWNLGEGFLMMSQQHPDSSPCSRFSPVVVEGVVYIINLWTRSCTGISLTTGAVAGDFKIK